MKADNLSVADHVNHLCRFCFYQSPHMAKSQRSGDPVLSFIMTRWSYCNSILVGLAKFRLCSIQSLFNSADRVVANKLKYAHGTDYIREPLCWLTALKIIIPTRTSVVGTASTHFKVSSQLCCPWRFPGATLSHIKLGPSCFLIY